MNRQQQLVFDFRQRAALGTEDFMVADCNREAVTWVDSWPHWPAPVLVVYGPAGCGKTHLVHRFLAHSGGSLLAHTQLGGKAMQTLITAPAVALDDVPPDPDAAYEEALLHVYNAIAEARRSLLLTAQTPPSRWPLSLPDLRSRLNAVPAVAVRPPDDILMRALLVKLFADRQRVVEEDILDLLVSHMERTFEAARSMVASIDEAAMSHHRRITGPFVRQVLRDIGSSKQS